MTVLFFLIVAGGIGVSWGAYQAASPAEPALSYYVPSGALLYLQAKDFSALLADGNKSAEKQNWLKSSNDECFRGHGSSCGSRMPARSFFDEEGSLGSGMLGRR